jgi:hypothetical protein
MQGTTILQSLHVLLLSVQYVTVVVHALRVGHVGELSNCHFDSFVIKGHYKRVTIEL